MAEGQGPGGCSDGQLSPSCTGPTLAIRFLQARPFFTPFLGLSSRLFSVLRRIGPPSSGARSTGPLQHPVHMQGGHSTLQGGGGQVDGFPAGVCFLWFFLREDPHLRT